VSDPIVIAGAGLSGLSVARALPRHAFRLFESEAEPGGLCRSIVHGAYTFDYTGHLLHLKGAELQEVERLLGSNLAVIGRRSLVHTHGREFDFPFQVHLGGLPSVARDECLAGFEAVAESEIDHGDFGVWSESVFGAGITHHFMRPYNEKLLRTRLEDLSTDWVHYIPRPRLEDVRAGARGERVAGVGYNAEFRYPVRGGIGVLPKALADGVPMSLGAGLEAVAGGERRVKAGGEWMRYKNLVSTIPMPQLLRAIEDVPGDVVAAAEDLEAVGVLCLNVGIDGPTKDAHWIYYPESKYAFFRVGFYHNIAPSSAPAGKSALYVEISYRNREDLGPDYRARAFRDLVSAGIIDDVKRVEECVEVWIDSAYAIHTTRRAAALERIVPYLHSIGITPIGRYGRWSYTSMGEALKEGRATGEGLGIA
jgi:protoporphyrinogen oxidase